MKFEIEGIPRFWFRPTTAQLRVLIKCSVTHYDHTCQEAGRYGGFIYGWDQQNNFCSDGKVHASWRELDLCLKILEGRATYLKGHELTTADELSRDLCAVLGQTRRATENWKFEFDA